MDYIIENFEEDMKIAKYVFGKYFKNQEDFKEDLLQTAVIALWENKDNYNEDKGKLSTYKFKIAYFAMLTYLRRYYKAWRKGHDYAFLISLSEEVPGTDGETIEGAIADETINFDEGIDIDFLQKTFEECGDTLHISKNNKFTKPILDLIKQGYCDIDISKKIGCTRQLPLVIRKKVLPLFYEKLKEAEYIS